MFSGSIPALVTPFSGGRVDEDTFRAFVDWQIGEGSTGLVPCGTTGEVPNLSADEHRAVPIPPGADYADRFALALAAPDTHSAGDWARSGGNRKSVR